jgi:molybdenum cofactor cytidylyltransferase
MPDTDENGRARPPRGAAIVLAAGASSRLGRPKQLVALGGKSLLRRAAEAAVASGASPVIVVLGSEAELSLRELAGLPVLPVIHFDWQQGMGSSLSCGAGVVQSEAPEATAVLCMVCDQPQITSAHLRTLWERYAASGKVIAVRYGDRPGVPAIFPAKHFPELARMSGDKGARSLLGSLADEEIELFYLPEAAFDVDTPEDLIQIANMVEKAR